VIDPATGLPQQLLYDSPQPNGPPKPMEEEYSDFREVNGIQVPFHVTYHLVANTWPSPRSASFRSTPASNWRIWSGAMKTTSNDLIGNRGARTRAWRACSLVVGRTIGFLSSVSASHVGAG